jgi:D-alanine transfer protein
MDRSGRPVGILAAVLAAALAVAGLRAGQAYALRLAQRYVAAVAAPSLPIKYEDLTFQRAALAAGDLLPIYGSSELFCCGQPDIGTQFFAQRPTGFEPFAVGRAGTGDLFFLETVGALGHDLRGRRVVLSESPQWFFGPQGITAGYDGNFSPEIATAFVFDAPLPLPLKEAAARRMLAHPLSLRGQDLLRLALAELADPTPSHLLAYELLQPAGRLLAWGLQLQDAWDTVRFIRQHLQPHAGAARRQPSPGEPATPQPSPVRPPAAGEAALAAAALPHGRGPIDWPRIAAAATALQAERAAAAGDPFGLTDDRRQLGQALVLYCRGRTNRDGQAYPYPAAWARTMRDSAEWTDLALELQALRDLGAQALVWTVPFPGVYDDYTPLSAPARQAYYDRFQQVVAPAGFPWLSFRDHDEDRYFMGNSGAHFSPRGWVFADRALDLFWHGQAAAIPAALAQLAQAAPAPGPPPAPNPQAKECIGLGRS